MLKILGARPHAPRPQYQGSDTMELPISLWLYNNDMMYFDNGDNSCTLPFVKYAGQEAYYGFNFEIRTSKLEVMKVYTRFFDEWSKWVIAAKGDNSINSFLSFLDSKKIPLVHWWDGMFYSDPETKCFKWFFNGNSQGRLFADSQIDALKRIQKRGKYLPTTMPMIRVEEVEFTPVQHHEIPDWIINNCPEH